MCAGRELQLPFCILRILQHAAAVGGAAVKKGLKLSVCKLPDVTLMEVFFHPLCCRGHRTHTSTSETLFTRKSQICPNAATQTLSEIIINHLQLKQYSYCKRVFEVNRFHLDFNDCRRAAGLSGVASCLIPTLNAWCETCDHMQTPGRIQSTGFLVLPDRDHMIRARQSRSRSEPAVMWTWLLLFISFRINLNQYFSVSSWNTQCISLRMLGGSRCRLFNLWCVVVSLFAKTLRNFFADRCPQKASVKWANHWLNRTAFHPSTAETGH